MTLTDKQLNELKADLLNMKRNLEAQETAERSIDNDPDELNVADNHLADSASEFVDRQQQMAENNLQEERLTEVNEALQRIDEGTYGICLDTGKEIPFERLKAVPYTKRTVEAEETHQKHSNQAVASSDSHTSKLLKPNGEMEDSRNRTLERLEEEHNTVEKADDKSRFNEEPNDQTKWE
ncbi:TraR/DksA family transcriptional regulator [Virgibacillus ihumii]|uniref:TraR/DksA family transcriptional regulator n=1 Tax=Virgibacillus ihumii TaxID=2686091 RepID=UPI001C2D660D|nr:TraR/DksA C4-type zinc finger protein [Virgibacillus ihumii]